MGRYQYKKNGLTLLEMMVTMAIFSLMVAGIYGTLSAGRTTWFDTDANIELQQNVRKVMEKITRELHESGFDKNNVWQVTLFDGSGIDGTDIIKFSMPIICENGRSIVDSSGDIAYWGAPLTWGCTQASCMDANNDCTTLEYKYVTYLINGSHQLVRRVLDGAGATVREDIIAQDIMDFQASTSADHNVIMLTLQAQRKSAMSRIITTSTSTEVYLRNRG